MKRLNSLPLSHLVHLAISFILRNMIVPLPKSQTRHPARAPAPLHLPHRIFEEKRFYKIFPLFPIVIAKSR